MQRKLIVTTPSVVIPANVNGVMLELAENVDVGVRPCSFTDVHM